MKRLILLFAVLTSTATAASATEYTTYLIPLIRRDLPGVNGSLWTTETVFRNRWYRPIPIVGPLPCVIIGGPGACGIEMPPALTTTALAFTPGNGTDGAFLDVPVTTTDLRPAMTLHVRDLSRSASAFGTEIYVPKIDEFQPVLDLIEVPTDPRYRATLRVYGSTPVPQTVRIRTFAAHSDIAIREMVVTTVGFIPPPYLDAPYLRRPSYYELDPLTPTVRASGDRVRVSVDVMGEIVSPPPPPVWAFITITDNMTQVVSTITPSR
jgi:hypothetical protein